MVVQLFFLLNHLTFGGRKEDMFSEYTVHASSLPFLSMMFLLNLRGGLISTLTSYGSISQEFLKVMMVNILLYLHMYAMHYAFYG